MGRGIQRVFGILSVVLIFTFTVQGAIVDTATASRVATGFLRAASPHLIPESGRLTLEKTYSGSGSPAIYVFNAGTAGFILLSAEDLVYPVLGYSGEGAFDSSDIPPALNEWIDGLVSQIALLRDKELPGDPVALEMWRALRQRSNEGFSMPESGSVEPLITAQWNQGAMYNTYCPPDGMGPAGRALVGCVAVAMGQVCHYYRYPQTGTGSSSYNHGTYGYLNANYGATTYRWDEMGNTATGKSHLAIAEMLYHMGVSVDMNYGPNASGAYSSDAASALRNYFGYDPSLTLVYKGSYSDIAWKNLLKSNLDAGHPMYYHGYGSGGHAFNVDGYQNDDFFHFNWGWGGSYNGYFYLTSLTPGGNDFSNGQGAIINFKPPASQYPSYCNQPRVITGLGGTLEDGSGPVLSYQSQTSCTWLLQPAGLIDRITLSCLRFQTENGNDLLQIFDGSSDAAPLLASFSGDTIWPDVTSSGSTLFLKFTSNATVNQQGWLIEYEAFPQIFCTNLQVFNSPSGSFDDGSGSNPYNNGSNCKYLISPGGGLKNITISFNYFSLEDGVDFLRVYDPTTTPSTLLGMYTGNSLPPDVTVYNGQAMLIFFTDQNNNDLGWEVNYTSTIGLQEPDPAVITISPNPSGSGIVVLSHPGIETPAHLELHDAAGRRFGHISTIRLQPFKTMLDLGDIPNGVYFLKISLQDSVITRKLILNR
ncbi:MAG TPA: C10 family peptidase [Bacteroidales bacterium]|nr:C10 family peptidase [Bacteroidales bacterium]HRZ49337.1 C10 family peptidase [Bacteroidales bacterium]